MLSVLIAAYNEEWVLEATVRTLHGALSAAAIHHEILVVNDGSADGTESLLIRLETEVAALRHVPIRPPRLRLRRAMRARPLSGRRRGHHHGRRIGRPRRRGGLLPTDRGRLRLRLRLTLHRRRQGGGLPAFERLPLNRLGNRLIGLMLWAAYDDFTNGFKCYRRRVIDAMRPLASGQFNLTIEMSIKAVASGARYAVVPTDWSDREAGMSKFRLLAQARLYLLTLFYTLAVARIAPAIARPARPASKS